MLRTRVASAAVFGPALLAIIWWGNDPVFTVFVATLVGLGGFEWSRLANFGGLAQRVAFGLTAAAATTAASAWQVPVGSLLLTAVLLWAIHATWLARYRFLAEATLAGNLTKATSGLLTLILAGAALNMLHRGEAGAALTLLLIVLIWAADVGAYFAGRALGRHKLAPRISPSKTWEGVVGGQLAVLLVIAVVHLSPGPLEVTPAWYAVAAVTAAVSVVGDLYVSLLKRQTGVKDTGRLIPGHGGILDRFDSAFAAAPIFAGGLALIAR